MVYKSIHHIIILYKQFFCCHLNFVNVRYSSSQDVLMNMHESLYSFKLNKFIWSSGSPKGAMISHGNIIASSGGVQMMSEVKIAWAAK